MKRISTALAFAFTLLACDPAALPPIDGEPEQPVEESSGYPHCRMFVDFGDDIIYFFEFDYVNQWWVGDRIDQDPFGPDPVVEDTWQSQNEKVFLIGFSDDGLDGYYRIETRAGETVTCGLETPEGEIQPPFLCDGVPCD